MRQDETDKALGIGLENANAEVKASVEMLVLDGRARIRCKTRLPPYILEFSDVYFRRWVG